MPNALPGEKDSTPKVDSVKRSGFISIKEKTGHAADRSYGGHVRVCKHLFLMVLFSCAIEVNDVDAGRI